MNTEIEKLNAEIIELCNHIPDAKNITQKIDEINEEKTQEILKLYLLEFMAQLNKNQFPIQIQTIPNESSYGCNAYNRFSDIVQAKGYYIKCASSSIVRIYLEEKHLKNQIGLKRHIVN